MENKVIKVLNSEHGKEVIKYWQSLGIDTRGREGICSVASGDACKFYGVIDGLFSNYTEERVLECKAEVIELPIGLKLGDTIKIGEYEAKVMVLVMVII